MIPQYYDALQAIARPIRADAYPRSLRPMRSLLAALDNPHLQFPAVVVTGSVGKGTTCLQVAHQLQAQGLRVGLYIGPHLHSFRERFVINGEMISPAAFVEGVELMRRVGALHVTPLHSHPHDFSTFELATALALWWFAQEQVDVAVLEVGIGGRWDAVNVAPNALAVFTPIEREHVAMLGGSLQTIAWHKAGIIQPGGQAITVEQGDVVMDVLENEAAVKGASLELTSEIDIATVGTRRALSLPNKQTPLNQALAQSIYLPGRFEQIRVEGRRVIIDGGHTLRAALRLRALINNGIAPDVSIHMVVGMLRDKSARDFLMVFDEPHFQITLTQARGHRTAAPETLAAHLQQARVEIVPDLKAALSQVHTSQADLFIVSGSLRMAAAAREFYGLLDAEALDEAQRTRDIFEGPDYLDLFKNA